VLVLAIETSTPCVGCALWDGAPLASFSLVAGPHHGEVLLPAIDGLCRKAGLSAADVEAVAVDRGPGLFTGLRVGLAAAAAIAMARDIPTTGVTSLDVLAYRHRYRTGTVAAMVDARRGEVYWALYRSDGAVVEPLLGPAVATPADVAAQLSDLGHAPLAVGDGAWRYRDLFAVAGATLAGPGDLWPSPLVVAELAALGLADVGQGRGQRASPVVPMYLRQADVRIGWDQVGGRVGPGQAGSGQPGPGQAGSGQPGRPGQAEPGAGGGTGGGAV